jgi:hypothetical protein
VVRLGWPPSPLVHQLACSVIVRPPEKRAIARGGGCHPTAVSPAAVEWSSYLGWPEGSLAVVWSWLKWEKPSHHFSLGRGGRSPFLVRSRGEPLDGASCHGPLQEWWLTTGGVHDDGVRTVSEGERLRSPNRLAMNSGLPKWMVSPRKNNHMVSARHQWRR